MMRTEIRELLIDIPSIESRVYEPSAAGPTINKPYLVLREGVQDASDPYKDYTTSYEVWPYVKRTTFQQVDDLSKEVISKLHRKRFNVGGVPHYIEYVGTITEDMIVEDWDALTRGLQFRVFSLAWLVHTPINPDPVEAMKLWTENNFPKVQTNPLAWNPTDEMPALYWRVSQVRSVEPTNWGAWMFVTLRGHVIVPSVKERGQYLDLVVRKLALDARTRMSDNSRMLFQSVGADGSYDPFGEGQISLNVRFGILPEEVDYEQIHKTTFDPTRGGAVVDEENHEKDEG